MGCIATKPRKPPSNPLPGNSQPRSEEVEQAQEANVGSYSPREPVVESPRSSLQIVPTSIQNKIVVRSKLTAQDVQLSDVTPNNTTRMDFRYNCPICMKFLSSILITSCCSNYLCHFCLADYQTKELHFQIRCPMCNAEPLILDDVDPSADVKKYSDSPYSTFKNSGHTGTKWVSKLAIVHEDEQLARELEEGGDFPAVDLDLQGPAPIGFSSTT